MVPLDFMYLVHTKSEYLTAQMTYAFITSSIDGNLHQPFIYSKYH